MRKIYVFVSEPVDTSLILENLDVNNPECKFIVVIVNMALLVGIDLACKKNPMQQYECANIVETVIGREEEAFNLIETIRDCDIALYHVASFHYRRLEPILKHLNQSGVTYGVVANNSIPDIAQPIKSRVKEILFRYCKTSLKIIFFAHKKIFKDNLNPRFVACAGDFNYEKYTAYFGGKAKVLKVYSRDYQRSLVLDELFLKTLDKDNYIVYVEQGDPFHPDNIFYGNGIRSDPDKYYEKINGFLNSIEIETGFEVIVALPPKTEYFMPELIGYFKNRKKFINKTPELVYSCKFVLMQSSTAVSFPVIFSKPIMFFTPVSSGRVAVMNLNMAKSFKKPIYSIDRGLKIPSLSSILEFDFNSRSSYQKTWLASECAVPLGKIYNELSLLSGRF